MIISKWGNTMKMNAEQRLLSQRKAVDKYHAKLDDVKVRFKKGSRDAVRAYAVMHGYNSLQDYIKQLVQADSGIEV